MTDFNNCADAEKLSPRQQEFLSKLVPVYQAYDDVSGDFEIIYRLLEDIARLEEGQQVTFFPRQEGACAFLSQVRPAFKESLSVNCVWKLVGVTWVCK